jgi:hypothetical protein
MYLGALSSTTALIMRPSVPQVAVRSISAVHVGGSPPRAFNVLLDPRSSSSTGRLLVAPRASSSNTAKTTAAPPVIKIDNTSDAFATKVSIQFISPDDSDTADAEEMANLIRALKNLDLNIVRGKVRDDAANPSLRKSTFYITDRTTSEKIVKAERLEAIRLAVEFALTDIHVEGLAVSEPAGRAKSPFTKAEAAKDADSVLTRIDIRPHESGTHSILHVRARDYPGILTEIVHVLKEINLNVNYAEINTSGVEIDDTFYVTYQGQALGKDMSTLVNNALAYYISLYEVEREESY